jgi:hypothetical protein
MASPANTVLELVVFRVKDGVTREQLVATSDTVSGWAQQQSGFVSRELSHDADSDRWIDIVRWRTIEDAKAAAAMSSSSCAPMFALIDMDSTLMLHAEPVVAPVGGDPTAAG